MNVLLSVDPQYAEAILSGAKRYEFRRTIFKREDIERVYIYANSTVRRVVGSFEIRRILEGTPQGIWNRCHRYAGISEAKFFEYFKGVARGYCIEIKNVHRFKRPLDPNSVFKNFRPPQSFYYISQFPIKS